MKVFKEKNKYQLNESACNGETRKNKNNSKIEYSPNFKGNYKDEF